MEVLQLIVRKRKLNYSTAVDQQNYATGETTTVGGAQANSA
jgi:hypothetical protein